MFAVVYKNRVIVGPMGWNRGLFEGSLEREKINQTLPRVPPDELPYVVNEDAKIMAVEEVRPEINPLAEYYYGPLWDVSGDKAIATYEVHDTPIEFARSNYKAQAADERWKKETAGTKVTVQATEVTVATDRDARNLFVQKHTLLQDGESCNWKFPEGWLTLSKQELGEVVVAAATYVQGCFDWEKTINDQIDQATTKEQLAAIQILEPKEEETPVA